MYLVIRFDDNVQLEDREAIINSTLLRDILGEFYYIDPETKTIDVEKLQAAVADLTMVYAHDTRWPVVHVTLDSSALPQDILYLYLGEGIEFFTDETMVHDLMALQPVPETMPDMGKYAWARLQVDIGETCGVGGNISRGIAGTLGPVKFMAFFWAGKSFTLEQEMLNAMATQPQEAVVDVETAMPLEKDLENADSSEC